MNSSDPQINIVIPLFNEESVFGSLITRLDQLMERSSLSMEIILVDDGSSDRTPDLMKEQSLKNEKYTTVFLSRNFGHQYALSAGLTYVNATDAIFILDGDLQDPPELLDEFYRYYKEGNDVVYAIRKHRKEHFLKKMAYNSFYRIQRKMSDINIPIDTGDFSLISRSVVDVINKMPEESRFIRGMRSWIGYKQIGIPYDRQERSSGKSKYTLKKLIGLALNGIFNFSDYPVRVITGLGFITALVSLIYLAYTIIQKYLFHAVPSGFTALLFVIILFGGVQLIALGIIGEYIIRIFFQVKKRPLFVVKESIQKKNIKKNG